MNEEFSLYSQLMAKPKTNEPMHQWLGCEYCVQPMEQHTKARLRIIQAMKVANSTVIGMV